MTNNHISATYRDYIISITHHIIRAPFYIIRFFFDHIIPFTFWRGLNRRQRNATS